jgi:hypothetical protein
MDVTAPIVLRSSPAAHGQRAHFLRDFRPSCTRTRHREPRRTAYPWVSGPARRDVPALSPLDLAELALEPASSVRQKHRWGSIRSKSQTANGPCEGADDVPP